LEKEFSDLEIRIYRYLLTREDALAVAMLADAMLVLTNPDNLDSNGVLTSKVYECMFVGKPILAQCSLDSEIRSILLPTGVGLPYKDVDECVQH